MDSVARFNKNLKTTSALLKILAQFQKKYVDQGNKEDVVKKYLDTFKELKNKHIVPEAQRDIDAWGHKPFNDFQEFVNSLLKTSSKTSIKKEPHKKHNVDGATFVTENDDWLIYRIDTFEGSKLLGSRNWCTVRREEEFDAYSKKFIFYYALSKTRPETDSLYKLAIGLDFKNGKYYWDSNDKQHIMTEIYLSELNIPLGSLKFKKGFI